MDPGQYREAMKAMAAEEATIDVSVSWGGAPAR